MSYNYIKTTLRTLMLIHVVQPNETIQSIADTYGISVSRLIIDNGLENPNNLVVGQSIVVALPEISYTVKPGDNLFDIANTYNVTLMQLLMNNPYLYDRNFIFPGDTLVIKYTKKGEIATHGNTTPYINRDILKKTLPYLTYLSILNYTATNKGDIITYYDDTEVIEIAKAFGVMPLLLLTTLTIQGEANILITYDILLNEDFQNKQLEVLLDILKTKGYSGVNISFQHVNISNLQLYENYFTKIEKVLSAEGYPVFVTINTEITTIDNITTFEKIDYSILNQLAYNINFMNYEWATKTNPPSPISSIYNIDVFLNYINTLITPEKVNIGLATLGYVWELPYSAGLSNVYSLTLDRAINLALSVGATILFDPISQTPFFTFTTTDKFNKIDHIVWFIDARSINALLDLVLKYKLQGTGIWNITIFNPQLWLLINSQFDIKKII